MASLGGLHDEKTESAENDRDNDTLKYQLLGPSLTKAGQDAVDQHKVRRSELVLKSKKKNIHCLCGSERYRRLSTMLQKAPSSLIMSKSVIEI